ncbi:hypothetical protein QMA10_07695 [Arthrobacter sp. APC 3897]|uniref:hypothetical protein n=1 Tax=Arthrobacter sp. APC 3897 TaxID=3035204 RepID=UPI0025B34A9A|nr:hypothetical protein [Arthrobacter sp. APC 3897]MDN3481805.1 hypothetical protein [Arthrobacter sp. APC 3897]
MPDLAQAVAELYALMPDTFTAARNNLAAQATKSGDKELGRAVRALPKPSAGAWLVNMLALHRPELISEVLELGAVLREAQDDMDQQQLRRLSGERQRLLRSAARDARSLAEELGRPVSAAVGAEVEQTLWAAMTDADAAAAAASGQLVHGLEANGWDPVNVEGSVADPASVRPLSASGGRQRKSASKSDTGSGTGSSPGSSSGGTPVAKKKSAGSAAAARALRAAKTSLDDARREAGKAEESLRAAQEEVDAVAARRDELTDEIDDLRDRIRELEHEVAATDRRAGTLERARDGARRTARAARRAVEKAQTKLDDLG